MKFRLSALILMAACSSAHAEEEKKEEKWVQLFNGKDLTGWSPKIRTFKAGENYKDTYRVQDGAITVSYDGYDAKPEDKFDKFGHLFYTGKKFSNYRLRIEYRFTGEQINGGPGWAWRNSGVMIHSEGIDSMGVDQEFPSSLEVQFLGGSGKGERGTGNLCTPGTNVIMDGKLITKHTVEAKPQITVNGDDWVNIEVEVHGNGVVKHFVNGQQVHAYEQAQLDEKDEHSAKLIAEGVPKMISEGYICLQSESHPVQFRKVEILELDK